MSAYLLCLTSGSGIPVFTRSVGNVKPLPFPVIGSLNAVHMFAANHNTVLQSTSTEDARVVWREFRNSLVLISVMGRDGDADDAHTGRFLENVFNSMILLYGLDELTNIKNVERFKKEIKICNLLIDRLVQAPSLTHFCDLTNSVDVLVAQEPAILQSFLDAFAEAADSPYGCLFVHGRVVVATSKWWELKATELVLLSLLMASFTACSSRDVPIYLPHGSPSIPHRLLTFELLPDFEVCVICGPTPSLPHLEREIGRFWAPAIDTLRTTKQVFPRNFPATINLDSNILGFLLVNRSSNRCLGSVSLTRDKEEPAKLSKRRAVLRSFYKHVVGTYFTGAVPESETGPTESSHQATDTYIVCSGCKCYAHSSGPYQIFIMYTPQIPTFAMRTVSQKTLHRFTKDKNIQI